MTIGGAIAELQNLLKVDDVPFYYKGGIEKVIETIQMDIPKQGKWVRREIQHKEDKTVLDCRVCSECGAGYVIHNNIKDLDTEPPRFCPNCGARMQTERSE